MVSGENDHIFNVFGLHQVHILPYSVSCATVPIGAKLLLRRDAVYEVT
jgi:hypothetical protein